MKSMMSTFIFCLTFLFLFGSVPAFGKNISVPVPIFPHEIKMENGKNKLTITNPVIDRAGLWELNGQRDIRFKEEITSMLLKKNSQQQYFNVLLVTWPKLAEDVNIDEWLEKMVSSSFNYLNLHTFIFVCFYDETLNEVSFHVKTSDLMVSDGYFTKRNLEEMINDHPTPLYLKEKKFKSAIYRILKNLMKLTHEIEPAFILNESSKKEALQFEAADQKRHAEEKKRHQEQEGPFSSGKVYTFPKLSGLIVDEAGMLEKSEKKKLSKMLKETAKESLITSKIVVYTRKSDECLECFDKDFKKQLFQQWKLGSSDVVLFIGLSDGEEKAIKEAQPWDWEYPLWGEPKLPYVLDSSYCFSPLSGVNLNPYFNNVSVDDFSAKIISSIMRGDLYQGFLKGLPILQRRLALPKEKLLLKEKLPTKHNSLYFRSTFPKVTKPTIWSKFFD